MADDDRILDSHQRAGVPLPGLRRVGVTGGGRPVWVVHPLPPEREPFASWRRLRATHDQTGLWPFLAGPDLKEADRQVDGAVQCGGEGVQVGVHRASRLDVG